MHVSLLYRAKWEELQKAGVVNPSEEAVRKVVTKEEMARHCRHQTRGVEETSKLLDSLFSSISTATDALGVPLFRDDMLTMVWPEQKSTCPVFRISLECIYTLLLAMYKQRWCQTSSTEMCAWVHVTGEFPPSLSKIYPW